MPELNFSTVDRFIEAVKIGAEEAAAAFARTFDTTITLAPKEGGKFDVDQPPPNLHTNLNEKGLALLLQIEELGVAVLVPSSTGLIPDWCDAPDATGASKLGAFAQEWGMNLVPEDFFADDCKAAVIHNLLQGLHRATPDLEGGFVELSLGKTDGTSVPAYIIWALTTPAALLDNPKPDVEEIPEAPTIGNVPPKFGGQADPFANADFATPNFGGAGLDNAGFGTANFVGGGMPRHRRLEDLPGYIRSALKVKVPVATILARAKKPIKTILELGVGSIIHFDKPCDEMLDVEVGQSIVIATAEAVKVGDKFGFRISSVTLPDERFRRVDVRREGEYHVKMDSPQIIGKAPIKSFDTKR